jgi:hypothetical protein
MPHFSASVCQLCVEAKRTFHPELPARAKKTRQTRIAPKTHGAARTRPPTLFFKIRRAAKASSAPKADPDVVGRAAVHDFCCTLVPNWLIA